MLATILSDGRSSRFYESIVRTQQLSTGVGASAGEARGPGLFRITATALPGKTLAELENAIDGEIARVQSAPVESWELEKARTAARRSLVNSLGSSLTKAMRLSQDALFYDSPGRINTQEARIAGVTTADVQRVARQYLVKTGRTVVLTEPRPATTGGQR